MDPKDRGIEPRQDVVDIAARRQSAINHWSGHAEALHRIGLLNEAELQEILEYADAAYSHVTEDLAYRDWLKASGSAREGSR